MIGNKKPTKREWDEFVAKCIDNGWTVRGITHPKSRANFNSKPDGITIGWFDIGVVALNEVLANA